MSQSALRVTNLGKAFRIYRSESQRVASWLGLPVKPTIQHWILRGVSFSLSPGEAIGIVGQNGAGKSTLLKLIAGTLQPTEGDVRRDVSVSAILELGLGFNPDFTGRQNALHAAGLMGFNREAIQSVMPEIQAFADIGDHFGRPTRTYSSGMQMRVAFAVATAFQPAILIVDEALSVGDVAFQRKSLRRIEQFLATGTTLLFVSHSAETIKRICSRSLWISDGIVVADGPSKEVCEAYERHMLGGQAISIVSDPSEHGAIGRFDPSLNANIETRYGDGRAEIFDFSICDERGLRANVIPEGHHFGVTYRVRFFDTCKDVHFGMMVKTVEGVCVYATNTSASHPSNHYGLTDVAQIRFDLQNALIPGTYYLNCGATHSTEQGRQFLQRRLDIAIIRISSRGKSDDGSEAGIANLHARVTIDM